VEIEYGLTGMILIVVNERLQGIQPFFPEVDSELGFFNHYQVLVALRLFSYIRFRLFDRREFVAAMLNDKEQISKTCHKRPVVDHTAIKPEASGSKDDHSQDDAKDPKYSLHSFSVLFTLSYLIFEPVL
jgi:hypothetical protein